MKLMKIILTDFKGFSMENSGMEFFFGQRNLVEGKNGAGKSTLMDAHLWLFTDKDSELKSNPDIRPDDGHECIPRIDEEWDINGVAVTISKYQKKSIGKPDANGVSKITLANKYEINKVPKTERDFKKELENKGFNFDNFLALSHPDVFTGSKQNEMRSVLFGMANSKSDKEIADMTDGCADVAKLLNSYRMDEIEAMNKASKKKAEEQIQAIPNQIIGMEKSKVNIDTAELELQRNLIKEKIQELENQISDSMSHVRIYDTLVERIMSLKNKRQEIVFNANIENTENRNDLNIKIRKLAQKKSNLENNLKYCEEDFQKKETEIERFRLEVKKAQEDYVKYTCREFDESTLRRIEEEQLDENFMFCQTCKQKLPETQKEEIIKNFEKDKADRIAEQNKRKVDFDNETDRLISEVIERGDSANNNLKSVISKKDKLEQEINQLQQDISSVSTEIDKTTEELNALPEFIDLSKNQDYIEIERQISEKEKEIESLDNGSDYRKSKELELKQQRNELLVVEAEISKSENDVRIDEQITELRRQQLEYNQKKADSESILYHLSLVSKSKNTLLENEINKWFDGVRFKLFDYLKNGEYKDVCILEILNEKGEWKSIGKTANTALEMKGKLAVIAGLQKFYGVSYPVFVDFAAELDNNTLSQIQEDFQVIFLKVSEGDLKVGEIE